MTESGWGRRFLSSTRGRVLSLLRRAPRTVNELADSLGLTDNAVRLHLTTLERDGLIRQGELRPGSRKPNLTYELTEEAEQLFPKPYGPLLQQLLAVLGERLGPGELEAVLATVGRRVAAGLRGAVGAETVRGRVEQAVAVLGELGGLAEVEQGRGKLLIIRGYDCPLGAAVAGHPCACRLAEALLSELVGVPVRECCARQAVPPRCVFEVPLPASEGEAEGG